METSQAKTYSIAQASQALKKSESSIKTYKKLVLEAFQKDLSRVIEPNGSLTEYGLEQVKKAAHFIAKRNQNGYLKAVFQANPGLEFDISAPSQPTQSVSASADYTGVIRGGSLLQRRSTAITNSFSEFDQTAANGELALIQEDITTQVENLDGLFSRYARAKVQKALTEIDHTVEALKANALAEMGATATNPKPSAQTANAS